MSQNKNTVIHWFRKGLRIHDNPSLIKACDIVRSNSDKFVLRAIFILDPGILKWMNVGPNRYRFLQQSLEQLHTNLQSINSRLYVIRDNPKDAFTRIFKEWNVKLLTFESDIEPYSKTRDSLIISMAEEHNIKIIQEVSHTIYDPNIILQKNMGKPPIQYQKFLSIASKLSVPEPLPVPEKLPKHCIPLYDSLENENPECYDCPKLHELVQDLDALGPNKYPGGETEALNRMEHYLKKTGWICSFEKPNTSPNSIEPSTTVLSPYLKFGCLSSRLFYKRLNEILQKYPKHSKPPVSLVGQLIWREFYYAAATGVENFDRMRGNSICYQIPWQKNEKYLKAWTYGQTGYPFIDAIMRQLRQEGWIHHLARHAVACFLTRGDLWISWEEGLKVFEELLLDADWALNAGNWMWLSASAFFYQYFRVYSPVAFGKKTDPDGEYIRKYVPELKKYPSGIIYEPWKATLAKQKEYGCIIGKDYPNRIVVHEIVSKENLGKMAAAYKQNKEGKVNIDSISKLFDDTQENKEDSSTQKRKLSPSPSSSSNNQSNVKRSSRKNSLATQKNTLTKYFKK